jgi:hypothetical protein
MSEPTRHRPDDEIRRIRNVWLGPRGMTLPFQASYVAWLIWASVLAVILLFKYVTPLHIGFPIWDALIACYAAVLLGRIVSVDKPLRMLPRVLRQHLTAPRPKARTRTYAPARRVRIRENPHAHQ